jgi:two-component system sensor histidine kinase KdpD
MNLTTEVLVLLGAVLSVALLGGLAMRYAGQAATARPIVEADRMRTMLHAAVSHDLRTPLAAAKAVVSCLLSDNIQLTAEDHGELLATADESLNQLTQLLASLLDVSRLRAGVLPVAPQPADLEEIIVRCLGGIGPQAWAVMVRLPPGLPRAMVDSPIMERVIANLTANALRYSPGGSPPLLTASVRGGRVILRVVDYGPGVPEVDRDRIFAAFQRLGDARSTIGVGLGLTVSRGLTEAMGWHLRSGGTPGGGLTMVISVPTAAGPGSTLRQAVTTAGTPSLAQCSQLHQRRHRPASAQNGIGQLEQRVRPSRQAPMQPRPEVPQRPQGRDLRKGLQPGARA